MQKMETMTNAKDNAKDIAKDGDNDKAKDNAKGGDNDNAKHKRGDRLSSTDELHSHIGQVLRQIF